MGGGGREGLAFWSPEIFVVEPRFQSPSLYLDPEQKYWFCLMKPWSEATRRKKSRLKDFEPCIFQRRALNSFSDPGKSIYCYVFSLPSSPIFSSTIISTYVACVSRSAEFSKVTIE